MDEIQREELAGRRARLQAYMEQENMDGCLVTQNVGLYYWTGSMQSGYLFIPRSGESTYYVKKSLVRALKEAGVRTVELGSFRQFGAKLAADYPETFAAGAPAIGADLDVLPAQLFLRLQDAVPSAMWKDASSIMRKTRSMKTASEVAAIRRAARIAADALEEGLQQLKEGMTELELMAIIENSMRRQGHIGLMRMRGYNQEIMTGVVAAGEAAAVPTYFDGPAGGLGLGASAPQSSSARPIRRGEPILLDIGCCVDGYTIDQTRTAVIGEMPKPQLRAYEVSAAIIRKIERMLRPGELPEKLYQAALDEAKASGLADHFMGFGADQVKFLGHGIGLEVDEWPVLARGFNEPLEPGMVLAIEPKFTFPGIGVVGIENTYLITVDGFDTLTVSPEKLYAL
ncbi:M24 family metallopeptidase [Cohnella thailandensis]|uniref:Aminopeptidase P family protein n=1 Tax=Cohnella thailandensis TaxID=557557 RepID=A0A841T8A2_9BACL|nr:Xaa-Pro peptidase family protein [Cohnella thailandensis]MBB6638468.1 aminopeptidase P family protein [Cohnella thailandensis]MBP1977472.1 Xaa-Pro aminopeptidase [Cohnella thailandensis]